MQVNINSTTNNQNKGKIEMENKELLDRVHTFLSMLCRDGRCGDYCSACLGASDLADDVWEALHQGENKGENK